MIGNGADNEDHPLLEQSGIDVISSLAAPGGLDHHRYQPQVLRLCIPIHLLVSCHVFTSICMIVSTGFNIMRWPSPQDP